jgi:hypothetical protein
MRRAYLTVYDYGMGGVWQYLRAESPDQIHTRFRDLTVFETPPEWMSDEKQREIEAKSSYDVETAEVDDPKFMALLLREPPSSEQRARDRRAAPGS